MPRKRIVQGFELSLLCIAVTDVTEKYTWIIFNFEIKFAKVKIDIMHIYLANMTKLFLNFHTTVIFARIAKKIAS